MQLNPGQVLPTIQCTWDTLEGLVYWFIGLFPWRALSWQWMRKADLYVFIAVYIVSPVPLWQYMSLLHIPALYSRGWRSF